MIKEPQIITEHPLNCDIKKLAILYHHDGYLFFRGHELTPEELYTFANRFGKIHESPSSIEIPDNELSKKMKNSYKTVPGFDKLNLISNVRDKKNNLIGALGSYDLYWHNDYSWRDESGPSHLRLSGLGRRGYTEKTFGCLLYCEQGDPATKTAWINQAEMYESYQQSLMDIPDPFFLNNDKTIKYGYHHVLDTINGQYIDYEQPLPEEYFKELAKIQWEKVKKHPLVYLDNFFGRRYFYLSWKELKKIEGLSIKETHYKLSDLRTSLMSTYYETSFQKGDLFVHDLHLIMHKRTKIKNPRILYRLHFNYDHITTLMAKALTWN